MDEPAPGMRASDADRERVAARLRSALSEGRLSLDEFDARVADVYAAKTYGELSTLTADLPAQVEPFEPAPRAAGTAVVRRAHGFPVHAAGGRLWVNYVSVNAVCLLVWLMVLATTGETQGFWFLWVAGPWGAALGVREVGERFRRP